MSAQEAKKKELERARQILGYALKEVSIVDRPANKRPFAVLKRNMEDQDMGAFITEDQVLNTLSGDVLDEETPETTVAKSDDSTAGEPADAEGTDPDPEKEGDTDPKDGDEQVTKGEGSPDPDPMKEFTDWLKEAAKVDGAPREAISQVAKILAGVKKEEPVEPAQAEPTDPTDVPTVQVFDDGRVVVSGQPVNKARRFTQGRTKKIAEMVTSMVKFLADVDEEAFKSLMGTIGADKADKGAEVTKADATPEAGAEKVGEMFSGFAKKLDEVAKKLDEIETARAPSKAADADDTAGAQELVEKKKAGVWNGVLW